MRLDYDAYRRKQQNLLQNDPANSGAYESNLEAARRALVRKRTYLVSKRTCTYLVQPRGARRALVRKRTY